MKFFISTFIFLLTISVQAQQLTSGTIEMGVTDFQMEMPETEGFDMGEMMKRMKQVMYFKPGVLVQEMSMMGMMEMKMFIVGDSVDQYMDVMGQKMNIKTNTDDMGRSGYDIEAMANMYQIEYDKSDRRKILGYDCYKVDIIMDMEAVMPEEAETPESMQEMFDNMKMSAYITEEIKMPMMQLQQFKGLQMEGTPLFLTMDMGMMSFTYEASSVSQEVDENIFIKPPVGEYKIMSMEDLKNMGMGNGGFGF